MNPLLYTLEEWEKLGHEKYTASAPALGAYPWHSNYHLCAVAAALANGVRVEDRVIEPYTGTAREGLRSLQEKNSS